MDNGETSSAKRTTNELFTLAAAFSASTLTIFITTSVNFDANLMVGIATCNVVLFIVVHFISRLTNERSILPIIPELIRSIFKRIFSITGFAILVFAITPGILAKAFVSNRDVANIITQARLFFSNQASLEYSFASAAGEYRFLQPLQVKTPPDNHNLLYILERAGRIYRLDITSSMQPELVLDIRDKVGFIEMENGALGFDFHPEYSSEPGDPQRIYLYYTDVRDNRQINRLSAFELNHTDLHTRSDSEYPLFSLERETSGFHNGGAVEFGPDGFLYIALGEGIRTPEYSSQADTLRMGILRIDVDKQGGKISKPISRHPQNGRTQNYFIPLDNPFLNEADMLEEYWALGLRNPFRASFDPKTNEFWVGDVGSTKWEEINLIKKGGHYQFPFVEGYEVIGKAAPTPLYGTETVPIYTYFHTASERAVIGGIVYRGKQFPEFEGMYLFADNYASIVYAMAADGSQVESVTKIAQAEQFAQRGISSVAQLADGSVIVTTLGRSSQPTGEVLKLVRGQSIHKATAENSHVETALTQAEVRDIFVTNCSRCHGASGRADGPDTSLLGVAIADFSSSEFQEARSDNEIKNIIVEGGSANGLSPLMPPWKNVLTEEELDGLVEYIRTLKQGNL